MSEELRIDLGIAGLGPAEHIGRGGFADVYRAEQLSLRRVVAVKVLRARANDSEVGARFERECHALGAVSDHPHIVGVHEGGFTRNGRAYIVMEYLPGGSLLDRLQKVGVMPVADVIDVGIKIGKALAVAHQAGVLHRDVKPANIMISAYGEPALGDFGIARVEGGHQTSTGLITASFAHAAPEVLEGQPATAAADIYALASTMYQLMDGQAPYYRHTDETVWPLMKRILSEPMPSVAKFGVSTSFVDTFERATARNPALRCANAEEFVAELVGIDVAQQPVHPLDIEKTLDPGDRFWVDDPGAKTVNPAADPSAQPVATPVASASRGITPITTPDLTPISGASIQANSADSHTARMATRRATPVSQPTPAPQVPQLRAPVSSRRTAPVLTALLAAVAVAVLGYFLLFRGGDDRPGEPLAQTASNQVVLSAAANGPLEAGKLYDLSISPKPDGGWYRLILDGSPVGEPTTGLPPVLVEEGRHSLQVELTTGSADGDSAVTAPVDFYALPDGSSDDYRAVLARVDVGDSWASVLATYDQLARAGHEDLKLTNGRWATDGAWSIYVGGFASGEPAGSYCSENGLVVPHQCYVSGPALSQ